MISVICPVLNEAPFIKAWCENVLKFSDDVHVFDCGSMDGTREILEKYPVQIHENPERYINEELWQPYLWNEGEIRNELINHCRGEWIVNLDADELLGQEFLDALPTLIQSKKKFIKFLNYQFWYSPNLIRIKQWKKDWWFRFYPSYQVRMFRNDERIRYRNTGNHAPLSYRGRGRVRLRLLSETRKIPFYHYHHLFRKINDNRADDINQSGVKLVTYFGNHPEETKHYDWFQARKIEIPARTDERIRELVVSHYDSPHVDKAERRFTLDNWLGRLYPPVDGMD